MRSQRKRSAQSSKGVSSVSSGAKRLGPQMHGQDACATWVIVCATLVLMRVGVVRADLPGLAKDMHFDIRQIDRDREISAADKMLGAEPITVTASHSPRSA